MTEAYTKLLGALVGLTRAAADNTYTETLQETLLDGLTADENDAGEVARCTEAAHKTKKSYAPNCSWCSSPCGRTTDAEMDDMFSGCPETAALKSELAETLRAAAADMKSGRKQTKLLWLLEGLTLLGENVSADILSEFLNRE